MTRQKLWMLVVIWCGGAALGTWLMLDYELTAATATEATAEWPAASTLARAADRPTLLMFVHPHCPCSRASLAELSLLAAQCRERTALRIVFVKPTGCDDGWEQTDLWQRAERIEGAVVVCDQNAAEADRFGVTTSGETLLYGADGRLLFQGGVTAARGHEGSNLGRTSLAALLNTGHADRSATPVFGCALTNHCCSRQEADVPCNP